MGLLNRLISTAVVIAVGTTLLPEVANACHQAGPERQVAQTEDMGGLRRERQTYLQYVQERLEVERLMR